MTAQHYNDDFVDAVRDFSDVVVAQFYGHTHTDTFRIFCRTPDCSSGLPLYSIFWGA
jgi:hypothetical protein